MAGFTYPDYLPETPPSDFGDVSNSIQTGGFDPAPPPDTALDEDGVDRALNGFIADKQAILYDGDDAFHGKTGYDALEAAPAVNDRLSDLRQEALDNAPNDYQRTVLGERLDAQLDEARDGIGRRLEQADTEAQLQTIDDRYGMLRAEAAYDHNDPDKIEGLATAAAQAAEHEARLSDHDDPASLATERRNGVYRSAIEANLAKGQPREALALYDRSKGSLGETMTTEMKDVATDVEAEDWVRRQEGAPTQETADAALADPDLSPAARLRAYQKVQAEIVGTENARVAEVERLDAAVTTATKDLATNPSAFKRGTLASLADGYQRADETDTAALLRAQAEQESFLRGYAQSPAQAQQRILDTLPASVDRMLLEQIGKHQQEAFDKDPWSAGTSIYPDVGAPKPLSDIGGRLDQARLISRHRDGIEVLPFSGGEISTLRKNIPAAPPQQQTDTLKELATLPPETLPPLASALVGKNGSDDFQSRSLGGALSFHADGAPEIADQVLRGAKLTQEKGDAGKPVIVTTQEWNNELRARLGDSGPVPPIVRDTIANIYTHNAERAGQGDEIDHDLLDKAIDITKDNIARQPEIMTLPYIISPDALNGGSSDVMLTPYAIEPEAPVERDDGAMPPSDETLPKTPVEGDNNGKQTPPDEISPKTPVEGDNNRKTLPGEISPEIPDKRDDGARPPSDQTSPTNGRNSTVMLTRYIPSDKPAFAQNADAKLRKPPVDDSILEQKPMDGVKTDDLSKVDIEKLFGDDPENKIEIEYGGQKLKPFREILSWINKSERLKQLLRAYVEQEGKVRFGTGGSRSNPGNPKTNKKPSLDVGEDWAFILRIIDTLLHELGHAIRKGGTINYHLSKTMQQAVDDALTTEGVARFESYLGHLE